MSRAAALEAGEVKELFLKSGALLQGHFQLSSGLHSEEYLQCALVLAQPELAAKLGEALAGLLRAKPDLILSPAMGGLIIGHEVARALGVRAYFTERENGIMTLRRGFALKPREKVVIVEDVITTGKSTGEVLQVVRTLGAEAAGVLSIVDRSITPPEFGVPFQSLVKMKIETFSPEACPSCRAGKPLMKPGSRTRPA